MSVRNNIFAWCLIAARFFVLGNSRMYTVEFERRSTSASPGPTKERHDDESCTLSSPSKTCTHSLRLNTGEKRIRSHGYNCWCRHQHWRKNFESLTKHRDRKTRTTRRNERAFCLSGLLVGWMEGGLIYLCCGHLFLHCPTTPRKRRMRTSRQCWLTLSFSTQEGCWDNNVTRVCWKKWRWWMVVA